LVLEPLDELRDGVTSEASTSGEATDSSKPLDATSGTEAGAAESDSSKSLDATSGTEAGAAESDSSKSLDATSGTEAGAAESDSSKPLDATLRTEAGAAEGGFADALGGNSDDWAGEGARYPDDAATSAQDGDGNASADAVPDVAQAPSTPVGLVAYYPFDETAGPSASDAAGNGETANLVGGAAFAPALRGNGVLLAGPTEGVSLPAGIVRGLQDFSVSAWLNLWTAQPEAPIFDFGDSTANHMYLSAYFQVPGEGQTLHFGIAPGGASENGVDSVSLPVGVGEWEHVAVTIASGTLTLFVNGIEVAQANGYAYTPASLGVTTRNWIGRSQSSGSPSFDGQIDEFRIYARALSAAEVAAQAKLQPLAWYKFDDGSGATARDASGNGNAATLVSGAGWGTGRAGGEALNLFGNGGYVQLPPALLANASSASVASWIHLNGSSPWQSLFNFGSGSSSAMFLTPVNGSGILQFGISTTGTTYEQDILGPAIPLDSWVHLAVTLGGGAGTLYINGMPAGGAPIGHTPAGLGPATSDWIGKSWNTMDPALSAQIVDFCVYDRTLSPAEVVTLAR